MLGVHWTITPPVRGLLDELSALNLVFRRYHPRPGSLAALRRASILNSAVYSARVENIPVHPEDPGVSHRTEVQNLVSAYNFVLSPTSPSAISLSLVRKLHQLTMRRLSPAAGSWRLEPWAIFNQAGVAVYLAPAHFNLPRLMAEYIRFIKSLTTPPPVTAAISQFVFEKIHPFADGNGRVGRLISALILAESGHDQTSEFESYLDIHRDAYYSVLMPNQDCTGFIEYFLTALVETSKNKLDELNQPANPNPLLQLLPRRREILNIVRDHPDSSFDFISRRFPTVKPQTLHYDLQQLQKQGFIHKHGVSHGAVYSSAGS